MVLKTSLISMLLVFQSAGLNKCSNDRDEPKITVVGEAIHIMDRVGVETDDGRRYYLVVRDQDKWIDKYSGTRMTVTGRLVPRKDTLPSADIDSFVTRQPKLRDGDTIRNARWKLVE